MPLLLAPKNVPLRIVRVKEDDPAMTKHLAALGVAKGGTLTLLDNAKGCAICIVKESRLAFDHDLCMAIFVEVA